MTKNIFLIFILIGFFAISLSALAGTKLKYRIAHFDTYSQQLTEEKAYETDCSFIGAEYEPSNPSHNSPYRHSLKISPSEDNQKMKATGFEDGQPGAFYLGVPTFFPRMAYLNWEIYDKDTKLAETRMALGCQRHMGSRTDYYYKNCGISTYYGQLNDLETLVPLRGIDASFWAFDKDFHIVNPVETKEAPAILIFPHIFLSYHYNLSRLEGDTLKQVAIFYSGMEKFNDLKSAPYEQWTLTKCGSKPYIRNETQEPVCQGSPVYKPVIGEYRKPLDFEMIIQSPPNGGSMYRSRDYFIYAIDRSTKKKLSFFRMSEHNESMPFATPYLANISFSELKSAEEGLPYAIVIHSSNDLDPSSMYKHLDSEKKGKPPTSREWDPYLHQSELKFLTAEKIFPDFIGYDVWLYDHCEEDAKLN